MCPGFVCGRAPLHSHSCRCCCGSGCGSAKVVHCRLLQAEAGSRHGCRCVVVFHLPSCVHGRVAMCLCHRRLAAATVLPCKTGCMARQYGLFGIALWAVSAGRRASAMLPAGVCRRFLPRLWPSASAAMALPVAGGEVLAYIWLWWTNCLLWDEKLLPDGSFSVKIMWQRMLLRTKSQFLHCAVGIIMYLCPR